MFRCLPTTKPSPSKSSRNSTSSITTIITSLPQSSKTNPFLFNSQNSLRNLIHNPETLPRQAKQPNIGDPSTSASNSNSTLYDYLVSRYQNSYCPNDAKQLHLHVHKVGFHNDMFLCNTLINLYVRTGDMGCAQKLFDEMSERNPITWSCLISGYTRNRIPEKAFELFRGMVREGFVPNHYVLGSVLGACQEFGPSGLTLGRQVHGLISKTRYSGDVVVSNVLISMYRNSACSVDDALRVFDEIKLKNSISWNSVISVCSQRGNVDTAFELFLQMQRDGGSGFGLQPNEYTFGSIITAACSCTESGLHLLEQVLARVEKSGSLSDLYVGSALVSGLAKFGLTDHAKVIFQELSERNAASMNGLMVGLIRQKQGEEAAKVFVMARDSIDLNLDSFVVLLSAFTEFEGLDEGKKKGKEVHGYVIRTGMINAKVAIGNGLINIYAKSGAITDATSVFSLMINKDSISWNSLISGFDQNGCFEDAAMSFRDMKRYGLMPSNFTLISALSACASLGWINLGQQLHGDGFKLGLDWDVSVSNALLALYAETGVLSQCQKLFFLMPLYDQVSWNTMVGAFANSESSIGKAILYFLSMMKAGWNLNRVTFISILAAVSSLAHIEFGHQVHALVLKHHVANDINIENALLAFYGKSGELDACEKIFTRMSERKDEVSWNAMISGYIHNELLAEAMDLVWSMLQRGQRLDSYTFATVLSACASVATLERGMEVHASGIRSHIETDVVVGSALVDMYAKCGRIDYASRFFELMPIRNVYSWNSMISGYARHGRGHKALDLFTKMKMHGQQPDHVTFVGVLSACSHVGLVEEGYRHFESMNKEYGLIPRMEHFSCMVDLLGRAGELVKIEDFINKMPMQPNILIWRTVLGAFARAKSCNTNLGRRAAEMLFHLEPQNAVNYVLLANMYASGGQWEEMAKARKAMRRAAVKKEAGCSWVTMKDGVHVFVAGDETHPEKDSIYKKLLELNRKIKEAGYVPQTKFVLYDLDTESKEELLSYHSEKLAVAFALTRKSEMPIRIMKNLRVCGDCHSAFKYISKVVGRTIVLRDSIRFHHFKDGACSCNDYW